MKEYLGHLLLKEIPNDGIIQENYIESSLLLKNMDLFKDDMDLNFLFSHRIDLNF